MTVPADGPQLPTHVLAERTHVRLPSRPHWIEAAVEFLRHKAILAGACQEERAGKVMIALHEALSNAIVHGNLELGSELKESGDDAFAKALAERVADERLAGRVVDIVVDCDAQRCRWIITDEGRGFNVAKALERLQSDDPEVLLSSGRGILIMKSFLDEVTYDLGGRRLILTLYRESGEEKRLEPRLAVQQPLRIAPIHADGTVDWDAAYEAVSRNFSENGIGVLQEGLAASDRVLIGFPVGGQMTYVAAEVRHCRNLAGDVVELGCRFHREPIPPSRPVSEVQDAVAAFISTRCGPQLPHDERRHHLRVSYTERMEVITGPGAAPIIGYARDLSRGGMSFIVQAPLPGEVSVVLPLRDGSAPLRARARIVRCNKIMEGFYDVGAQFVELD